MTFLRDFSIMWSLVHTLILFLLLFESRFSKKKTSLLVLATIVPLIVFNFLLALFHVESYGTIMLISLSLPSFILFLIMSKYRDGRFFFTFCMVDTVSLEIIYITQIINHYVSPDTYWFLFIVRLLIFPILEWIIYKKLRNGFREIQKYTPRGWGTMAAIGVIFYISITLLMNHPTSIIERPEYYPALILMFLLMPIIYIHMFTTLRNQHKLYMLSQQEDILQLQTANIIDRITELSTANEKFREERHNFRHKLKTIASLVDSGQYEELSELLREYNETFKRTQIVRYSKNAIIDAVLSVYIKKAESCDIKVNVGLAFPDPIPVNEAELATAFANAIENAIHACEKLPKEKRFIDIKVLCQPRFMIQIRNGFEGHVEFDEDGIPVNRNEEHGFGTRSIAAFCDKNGGYSLFKAKDGIFTCYLNF